MKKIVFGIIFVMMLVPLLGTECLFYAYGDPVWDPNMTPCVGSDGTSYSLDRDYWVCYYQADGEIAYMHTDGGKIQKKLRIISQDGTVKTVYCIGAGLSYYYGDDAYAMEDPNEINGYYTRLPFAAQQGIALALMFGYEDGKISPVAGTNEDDYWMATQALVWEYQQGLRTGGDAPSANGAIRADVYYNIVRGRPAEQCYDWIVAQIQQYLSFPSFVDEHASSKTGVYVLTQQEKQGQYFLELYDTNRTGVTLHVCEALRHTQASIEIDYLGDYRYLLQTDRPIVGTFLAGFQKDVAMPNKKLLFFSNGSETAQVVACRAAETAAYREVRYMQLATQDYVERGNLQIEKYFEGKEQPWAGIPFQVTGVQDGCTVFDAIVETDIHGRISLTDLPVGDYQIEELAGEQAEDYVLAPCEQAIVSDGETTFVVIHNYKKVLPPNPVTGESSWQFILLGVIVLFGGTGCVAFLRQARYNKRVI